MKKKVHILIKTGRRYNSSFFRLHAKSSDKYKTGFVANRKTGNASARTRIKRIIREFWRRNFTTGDFLFILKPEIAKAEKSSITKELETTSDRIKKCGNS